MGLEGRTTQADAKARRLPGSSPPPHPSLALMDTLLPDVLKGWGNTRGSPSRVKRWGESSTIWTTVAVVQGAVIPVVTDPQGVLPWGARPGPPL